MGARRPGQPGVRPGPRGPLGRLAELARRAPGRPGRRPPTTSVAWPPPISTSPDSRAAGASRVTASRERRRLVAGRTSHPESPPSRPATVGSVERDAPGRRRADRRRRGRGADPGARRRLATAGLSSAARGAGERPAPGVRAEAGHRGVALELYVDAGILREARPGLAALTGRLLEEGTTSRDAEAVARAIEDVGGSLEVGATGAVGPRPRRGPGDGAGVAGRHGHAPGLPERGHRPGGAADRRPSCGATWMTRPSAPSLSFRGLVYGSHPLGRDPRGGVRDLVRLTRPDVVDHHRRHFVPEGDDPGGGRRLRRPSPGPSGPLDVRRLAEAGGGKASVAAGAPDGPAARPPHPASRRSGASAAGPPRRAPQPSRLRCPAGARPHLRQRARLLRSAGPDRPRRDGAGLCDRRRHDRLGRHPARGLPRLRRDDARGGRPGRRHDHRPDPRHARPARSPTRRSSAPAATWPAPGSSTSRASSSAPSGCWSWSAGAGPGRAAGPGPTGSRRSRRRRSARPRRRHLRPEALCRVELGPLRRRGQRSRAECA